MMTQAPLADATQRRGLRVAISPVAASVAMWRQLVAHLPAPDRRRLLQAVLATAVASLATAGIPDSGPGGVTVTSAGVSDEERGNPIDSRARRVLTEAGYGVGADDVSRATGSARA